MKAGYGITTGYRNIAIGSKDATYGDNAPMETGPVTGDRNIAIGPRALNALTSGILNFAIGDFSLNANTTGSNNIGFGQAAGSTITTGSNNIYFGPSATASAATVSNEIVICNTNATGKGANTGFINPNGGGVYQGNNSAAWSVTSDQRLKKNIVHNDVGLNVINAIQVCNFEYRLPEEVDPELSAGDAILKSGVQLGVIAQELQAVLPDCVKQESTGVLSVDSDNLTWYTINAIKQLSAALDAANARIAALEAK
jgi:hypothetical protein